MKKRLMEKEASNKTPALRKSMTMDIGVVGTSNQIFGTETMFFFLKKNSSCWQNSVFLIGPFCIHHSILASDWGDLYRNVAFLIALPNKKWCSIFLK